LPGPVGPKFWGPLTEAEREASLITGVVVDGVGHPVKGAKVDLLNLQSNALLATTTTDHSGFYSFLKTLEDGEYRVKVTHGTLSRVQKVRAAKAQLSQLDFKL
jgi:5-hydroxyisourate hydrolase-like protein (transthyretin family)